MTVLQIDVLLLIEKLVLIAIIVFASLGIALYTTFAERKVAAILQDRPGPERAGPFGLLQPFADGLKLIMKEEIIPSQRTSTLLRRGEAQRRRRKTQGKEISANNKEAI